MPLSLDVGPELCLLSLWKMEGNGLSWAGLGWGGAGEVMLGWGGPNVMVRFRSVPPDPDPGDQSGADRWTVFSEWSSKA